MKLDLSSVLAKTISGFTTFPDVKNKIKGGFFPGNDILFSKNYTDDIIDAGHLDIISSLYNRHPDEFGSDKVIDSKIIGKALLLKNDHVVSFFEERSVPIHWESVGAHFIRTKDSPLDDGIFLEGMKKVISRLSKEGAAYVCFICVLWKKTSMINLFLDRGVTLDNVCSNFSINVPNVYLDEILLERKMKESLLKEEK